MNRRLTNILLALLFAISLSNLQAQCPGAFNCQAAQLACSPAFLNGLACTTLPFPNGGQVNDCGPMEVNNIQWWGFVGDGGWVDITITIGNCPGANLGAPLGIEAGVVPYDCGRSGWFFWTCDIDCDFPPTNTVTLSGPALLCENYFLWIDGCVNGNGQGAICDFTITVNSTMPGPVEIPKPMPPITRRGTPCVCGDVELCIPDMWDQCSPNFRWEINDIPTGDIDECITINFIDTFPMKVCVEAFTGNPNNPDACSSDTQCIIIQAPPPEIHIGSGITNVCFEDQPYIWHGRVINSSCVSPPCTTRAQLPNDCCVDSVRQFVLLPQRDIGMRDTFFCTDGLFVQTEDGRVWTRDACDELITFPDARYRCDTSYYWTINFFRYNFGWDLDCGGCAGALTLCPNVEYAPNCTGPHDVTMSLDWYEINSGRRFGTTLPDECIDVKEPGTYCFDLTAFVDGVACPQVWQECFEVTTDFVPEKPDLTGDTVICADPIADYYITLPPDVCDVFWVIQSGGGRILSPNTLDSAHVVVDWSRRAGNFGTICVRYTTDCGESKDSCLIVEFLNGPMPFSGNDTVFCSLNGSFNGTEDLGGNWRQIDGPTQANINNTFDINSDVSVSETGTYTFVWEEENEDCEIADTVRLSFGQSPLFGAVDTFCIRTIAEYFFEFAITGGHQPYQIISGGGTIDGSNVYRSDTIPTGTISTVIIADAFGCETTLIIDYDCDCGNRPGELATDTIKLCGNDATACVDYDATSQILNPGEDTVMFVLFETSGQLRSSALLEQSGPCFMFNPATMNYGQVYYLGVVVGPRDGANLVDYDAGCVHILEAQPVIWYDQPFPDAGKDTTLCASEANLNGTISINGSNYRWISPAGVNVNNATDLNSSIEVGENFGSYDFILEETIGSCIAFDTVNITFFDSPEGNPEEICVDLVNFRFVVKFLIEKGQPPYTIISGGGSINPGTNEYVSDTFPDLTMYTITIEDANGCQFTFTDQHKCDCGDSDPGTMNQDEDLCVGDCIKVYSNGSEVLQDDEEAEYVLHEGSGSVIINELDRRAYDHRSNPPDTVVFCFDPATMQTGKTYYISRSIHEVNMLDDPCSRLAEGQAVTWHDIPTVDAGSDVDICGLDAMLNGNTNIGTGSWTLIEQPVGANAIFSQMLAAGPLTVDTYGRYVFEWRVDNEGCIASDTLVLNFRDAPRFKNVVIVCEDPPESYRIYFEVVGGDEATWTVTSGVNFQKSFNIYTSELINSGDQVNVCITDVYDCMPECFDITHVCECITEPGMINGEEKLCLDECLTITHNGIATDANDIVRYILHDGDQNNIGANVIACQSSPDFCFDANSMVANTQYFITAVVGNDDGNGCVDLNERCSGQTLGIPVTWYEYPVATINPGGSTFTCETDSISLDASASSGVGLLNYRWEVISGALCFPSTSVDAWVCSAGTYVLVVEDQESGCVSRDTITIDADEDIPQVDAGNGGLITCDQPTVTLDGSNSEQDPSFDISWLDPTGQFISNNLIITVSEPGTYTLMIRDTLTECIGMKTVVVMEDRDQPDAMLAQIGSLTCKDSTISLEERGSITKGGIRSYEWSTVDGNILGSNILSSIDIDEAGTYQLVIIDDQNGCRDTVTITVVEENNTFQSLDLAEESPTCVGGSDGSISILNVFGGASPFQFAINGGPFSPGNSFGSLTSGDYLITVIDDNGCEYDTLVTLFEPSGIDITAKDDQYIDEGEDMDMDTLIASIGGTTRMDADSIVWFSQDNGRRVGRTENAKLTNIKVTETFRVVLYKDGCQTEDFITIHVTEIEIFVPNVFNGGSTLDENSKLYVFGSKGKINDIVFLRIYDRWGEKIFDGKELGYDKSAGRSQVGWDGKFNGEDVLPGVYIYHLRVLLRSGKERDVFGDVTVIK